MVLFQSKMLVLGCHVPFVAEGQKSTPKILHLVMVHNHTKCSSSSYNSWGVEIAALKDFEALGAFPLGAVVCWPLQTFLWSWRVTRLNLVALLQRHTGQNGNQ